MPRLRMEYAGCSVWKRARPRRSATHCASTMSAADVCEAPIARTLPLRIRSGALLDAAAAEGAVRGDVEAEDLLYAVAQLCQPVPGRGPEHSRRIVGVLVDGLRCPSGDGSRASTG